jgi:hypothetical protein
MDKLSTGGEKMPLLIGWSAIIKHLPGITEKRAAKRFFKRCKVRMPCVNGKPVIWQEELRRIWETISQNGKSPYYTGKKSSKTRHWLDELS